MIRKHGKCFRTVAWAKTFKLNPKHSQQKQKNDNWKYIKLKSFCTAKKIIQRVKTQHIECKRTLETIYVARVNI
jgi:hypothetical protein